MGIHPNDANGDVLGRMEAQGDDLNCPRNIDFTVIFSDQNAADQFAGFLRSQGHKVLVEENEYNEYFPWDVVVVQNMVPSHTEITNFEKLLQDAANAWGGRNDGWACLSA